MRSEVWISHTNSKEKSRNSVDSLALDLLPLTTQQHHHDVHHKWLRGLVRNSQTGAGEGDEGLRHGIFLGVKTSALS